jgi:antitoxin (DNA-binding transcriptional repressor) of toxin-antitoxin stability system
MATINIDDAVKELTALIARARSGEEIVIADGTGNAVRLAPVGPGVTDRTSYRGRCLLRDKARVSNEDLFGPPLGRRDRALVGRNRHARADLTVEMSARHPTFPASQFGRMRALVTQNGRNAREALLICAASGCGGSVS